MLSVQFCGATRTVTGSQYYLEYTAPNGEKFNFCIDSGMFQVGGKVNLFKVNSHLVFDPKKLDAIVLTHAHLDHCGRIPYLVKSGFGGKIYSTPATQKIAEVVMTDAAKLATSDQHQKAFYFPVKGMSSEELVPEDLLGGFDLKSVAEAVSNPKYELLAKDNVGLYELADVEQTMTRFKTFGYHKPFKIHDNLQVEFWDAGHILGSAFLNITELSTGKNIVFSGDLGNINKPIIEDPETPKPIDKLSHIFIETTYGDRLHGSLDPKTRLQEVAFQTLDRKKGKLLIPAFSIERCQEIIYILTELMRENKLPNVPIFLDSPMGAKVLEICIDHPELYDERMTQKIKEDMHPLIYKNLKILEKPDQSKTLNHYELPCIIIAGSGMLNGGRILKHLTFHAQNPDNTILIVGYQAEGTLGRKLIEGHKKVMVEDKEIEVNAEIKSITEFSAHADQLILRNWIGDWVNGPKPSSNGVIPTVFLMHGEKNSSLTFGEEIKKNFPGRVETYWPYFGEKVKLWE
jgi:metallo-beta-lactamase family protein